MLTAQQIKETTFEKSMRGYNTEDVNDFLNDISVQIEQMESEKAELEKKLYVLAEKVAEYRKDEDNLKTALINAQRLGEQVIQEAKQKAELIVKEAAQKAQIIKDKATNSFEEEKLSFAKLQAEVAEFKGNVLELYKHHIESLSTLPDAYEDDTEEISTDSTNEISENLPLQQETEFTNETENNAEFQIDNEIFEAFKDEQSTL